MIMIALLYDYPSLMSDKLPESPVCIVHAECRLLAVFMLSKYDVYGY